MHKLSTSRTLVPKVANLLYWNITCCVVSGWSSVKCWGRACVPQPFVTFPVVLPTAIVLVKVAADCFGMLGRGGFHIITWTLFKVDIIQPDVTLKTFSLYSFKDYLEKKKQNIIVNNCGVPVYTRVIKNYSYLVFLFY